MAEETFEIIGDWLKKKFECPECGSSNVNLRTKPDGWITLIPNSGGKFANHGADLGEPEPDQVSDGGRCVDCGHNWDEGEA